MGRSPLFDLSDRYIAESAALSPCSATAQGIPGYDHLLTDYSPDGQRERHHEHAARREVVREALVRWYMGEGDDSDHRASVITVVKARDNNQWIACSCQGNTEAPPLLSPAYLSEAETYYLRRLTSIRQRRPEHHVDCPFFREQAPPPQEREDLALVALDEPGVDALVVVGAPVLHPVLLGEALELAVAEHRYAAAQQRPAQVGPEGGVLGRRLDRILIQRARLFIARHGLAVRG